MFLKSKSFIFTAVFLLTILVGLTGTFGVVTDTAKELWKFNQDFPHASMLVLLDINQQEDKVPVYQLPPLLQSVSGIPITSAMLWQNNRQDLLAQFSQYVYGQTPDRQLPVAHQIIETDNLALNDKAIRQQVELDIAGHKVTLLIYRPNNTSAPVPAFLGLNFRGNHTISNDPAVLLPKSWVPIDKEHGVLSHRATEANRGQRTRRYPLEDIIDRGYAFVTAYYGDFYPDHINGQNKSIHQLFETMPNKADWGAIGAWSWGLSRMLDYLQLDSNIDGSKVIAIGHSRLGKAALWAGAQDQRFAAVISNNSGAVGAAISRRKFGETVNIITEMFPHWFTPEFKQYANNEDSLPVDQHQLIALIAPRPVYVASADKDKWADPRGEFIATAAAIDAYKLFAVETNDFSTMPDAGGAIPGFVSYHLREGRHDLLNFDWQHYLNFADCNVVEKSPCQ